MAEQPKLTTHETLQKTLQTLMKEHSTIKISRMQLHQAFDVPLRGTESSLSPQRMPDLKMVLHPGYGYICEHKGKYFLIEKANVIGAYE